MKLNITVTYSSLLFCWDFLSSLNFLLHVLSKVCIAPNLNKLLVPPPSKNKKCHSYSSCFLQIYHIGDVK